MNATTLTLNPAVRIICRRGQHFAWEPSFKDSVLLSLDDLFVLGHVLAAGQYVPADDWRADWWRSHSHNEQRTPDQRIAQLLHARILLPGQAAAEDAPRTDAIRWQDRLSVAEKSADLDARYRLARNCCLLPGASQFSVWSPRQGRYLSLPIDVVMLALWFGNGRSPGGFVASDSPDREDLVRDLQGLLDAGVLVHAPEKRVENSGSQKSGAVTLGLPSWDGLSRDHRTPIYFVTHSIDHLPLALGMMHATICQWRDGMLLKHYQPLPIVLMTPADMLDVYRRFGEGIWLFSNYMWSIDYNLTFSKAVKTELGSSNLTIHGGPSTPKYESACQQFLRDHPEVDIAVRGEGELTVAELLAAMIDSEGGTRLGDVAGITYRDNGSITRTPERFRAVEVDQFPSPYLSGAFDNYGGRIVAAILETNRGCPYACTFCDWGSATQQKIRRFDIERIKAEIDWIGQRNIRVLWIADANFGIFERDVEITQHIADTKEKYGFPREVVVNYPKNATEKIARVVQILVKAGICGQGIISIQTTDPQTLGVIRRSNIKTRKYDELGEIFRSQNLPLSTDLMIGLPGATVQSFKADLQYYFNDDVTVKAYRTQLLPNSPMADPDYLRTHQIRTDDNRFLTSTVSYSEQDLQQMLWIWTAFDIADGYALLRYVMRFLQWEHNIKATDFLHRLTQRVLAAPSRYPAIAWILRSFLVERYCPGGWSAFYNEVNALIADEYGVKYDPGLAVALRVNELLMPEEGRVFPQRVNLDHDCVAYFLDNQRSPGPARRSLSEYPAGTMMITDPFDMCRVDYESVEQYDNHQVFYELESPISRLRSSPNFVINAESA